MTVVAVRNLVKDYGPARAVDGISFEIESGEVYGLLGENGAGKSTTVEILEGHRRRTAGDVTVLGEDPGAASRSFRDRIGIVLQTSGVEPVLTVRELLALYAGCYRRARDVGECIGLVGLDDSADKRVAELSGGQQRRLDLALGIVGYPELLFLDEPTTGFDPAARRNAWELIRATVLRRHDRAADVALPRRGRAPRRPGRCAAARSARRRGHTRIAGRRRGGHHDPVPDPRGECAR